MSYRRTTEDRGVNVESRNWEPRSELAAFTEGLGTRDERIVNTAVFITMKLLRLPFYPRFPVYNFYWGSMGPSSAGVGLDLKLLARKSPNWKSIEYCHWYFKAGKLLSRYRDELSLMAKYIWGNGNQLKADEVTKAKRITTNLRRLTRRAQSAEYRRSATRC